MPNPPAYWNDLTDEERAAVMANGPARWDYDSDAEFAEANAAFRARSAQEEEAEEERDDEEAPSNPSHAAPFASSSAAPSSPDAASPPPDAAAPTRADGWTAARQRSFLESLAEGHSVEAACRIVGMTHQSAYNLRRRATGTAFALGWDAALLLARQKLADTLMVRAIEGQVETITRANGDVVERHRYDNRLATAMLTRLDRLADAQAREGTHQAARMVAQEFDAFLSVLDSDSPARAALFLYGRAEANAASVAPDLAPVVALARADRFVRTGAATAAEVDISDLDIDRRQGWTGEQWQRAEASGLVQIAPPSPAEANPEAEETDDDGNPQLPQLRPESAGSGWSANDDVKAFDPLVDDPPVWFDDRAQGWRTRFPPPPDFGGKEVGDYDRDSHYVRTLTDEEWTVLLAGIQAENAARRERDEALKAQWLAAPWFGAAA